MFGRWIKMISLLTAAVLCAGGLLLEVSAASFPDVADNAWYDEAVKWAVKSGTASGRGGYFKPDDVCTRAEAVAFLYKLAGSPEVSGTSAFPDAAEGDWFFKPVIWAVEKGITSGYGRKDGAQLFSPNVPCSRAMIVTFIQRFAAMEGKYKEPEKTYAMTFPDVPENAWYRGTVRWAAEAGITNGKGDGTFCPLEGCSRAQIVGFLYNYSKFSGKSEDIELPEITIGK
ncbi:MAG: S-layer homology domain-containing protein [Lachnospiraceae bacterium]|nr:S-layer homology domain-containing protein [Lachnospiraceae bacterium]